VRQGDVYWVRFEGVGSEPRKVRPALVVQDDRFDDSAIRTTIVVALTTTERLAFKPGNVRLRKGEANLPRPSVVNVTQVATVDRARLGERIGSLSRPRLVEVLRGLLLVLGVRAGASPG